MRLSPNLRGGPPPARSRRFHAAATGVLTAVIALGRLLLTGNPFVGPYSEDGAVFLPDAASSAVDGLLGAYAGYAHLLPRLLATVTVQSPIGWWPAITVITSLVIAGVLGSYVFDASSRIGLRGWRPAVAALVPVILPGSGHELLGNWANLQWLLLYAAVWAVIAAERRRDLAVVVLASATSPVVLLLTALVAVSRRPRAVVLAIIGGSLFHAVARLVGETYPHPTGRHPGALGSSLAESVLRGFIRALVDSTAASATGWRAVAGVVLLLLAVAIVLVDRTVVPTALLVTSLLVATVTAYLSGDVATRYSATAAALLVPAVLLTRLDKASAAFAVAVVIVAATSLPVPERRVAVVPWVPRCGVDGRATAAVGPGEWGVAVLPCSSLGGALVIGGRP